jgi:hypothetical protein
MTIDLYVISHARLQAGLSQKVEQEFSDFVSNNRDWISLRGNSVAFNTICDSIKSAKDLLPFLEMKATVADIYYHVLAQPYDIMYVKISMEDYEYEYKDNKWYYTKNNGIKKRFTLTKKKQDNDNDNDNEKNEFRNNLYKIFKENEKNPVQLFYDMITDLNGNYDDNYDIDAFPEIEWNKLNLEKFKKVKKCSLRNVKCFFEKEFQSWDWETAEAGYSYYCNEPSYSHFDVDYRYGIVRVFPDIPCDIKADSHDSNDSNDSNVSNDSNDSDESNVSNDSHESNENNDSNASE